MTKAFLAETWRAIAGKPFFGLPSNRGRGSGGVESAGVSQSVRETRRDETQTVPSPEKLFKTRDLELPIFEGSVPSCSPHSAGYTRTCTPVLPRDQPKGTVELP